MKTRIMWTTVVIVILGLTAWAAWSITRVNRVDDWDEAAIQRFERERDEALAAADAEQARLESARAQNEALEHEQSQVRDSLPDGSDTESVRLALDAELRKRR